MRQWIEICVLEHHHFRARRTRGSEVEPGPAQRRPGREDGDDNRNHEDQAAQARHEAPQGARFPKGHVPPVEA